MKNVKSIISSEFGLLKIFNLESLELIRKEEITVNNNRLIPGQKTTLDGFFNSEVVYLGLYNQYMQFQIGIDSNLFATEIYSNEFKKIDETTILTIYQPGTARDYNFKNGAWK